MAGTPEFAEFVATLSADDRELQKDLRSAEELTRKSATKMQQSLDGMKISAGNLSGVMGTLSQAGAAVGGSFGGIVGQGVAATQAIAQMSMVVSGPVGLIAALAALTVGVFAYREEAGKWLNSILQSIGVLEDLDAALAKVEARNAVAEQRLDKQIQSQAKLNRELEQAIRLKNAQQTKSPEFLLEVQREIALEKRIAQELASGGSQKSVDLLTKIDQVNQRAADSKKRQLEFDQMRANLQKEELERARKLDAMTQTRLSTARGLLVQIGAASPSDFIDDPVLKRLALLGEMVAARNQAAGAPTATPARTGTFGLSRIQSPLAVVRAGEVIGTQTLTIQQATKRVAEEHRDIAKELRTLLTNIDNRGKGTPGRSSGLVVNGRP